MNADNTPPRPRRRWPWVAAALGLALVAGSAICESLGWPFLAYPMQRWLTQTLDRRVSLSLDDASPASIRIRWIGDIRLQAPAIEIGAPSWSKAPYMLRARDATMVLRYRDLWRARRGEPLRIERLDAAELDGDIERLADGRASWHFGASTRQSEVEAQPFQVPLFRRLKLASGTLRYRDEPAAMNLSARVSLRQGEVPRTRPAGAASEPVHDGTERGLEVDATGTFRDRPVTLALRSPVVLPWVASDSRAAAAPMTLEATVGGTHLSFEGTAMDALRLSGLKGRFDLSGPSLAAVGDPLHMALPTTGAFRAAGILVKHGSTWRAVVEDMSVGASRLSGAFTYEAGREVPVLSGRLSGRELVLADLAPALGGPSKPEHAGAGRRLPHRHFDLPSLRLMDANVLVDIDRVDLGSPRVEALQPLRGFVQLHRGVLTLTGLDARTAQGRVAGNVRFDGRGLNALWRADFRVDGVRLERWVRHARGGQRPSVTGVLEGRARVDGQGRSTSEILASLQGNMRVRLRNGAVSPLAIEAAGAEVSESLGVTLGRDGALPIQCAVADIAATRGVLTPRAMMLDTGDSTLWVDGVVSLVDETIDLRMLAAPSDFSPLALRSPVRVQGTFGESAVSLHRGPVARRVGSETLLAMLNPAAAMIAFLDPPDPRGAHLAMSSCPGLGKRGDLLEAGLAKFGLK